MNIIATTIELSSRIYHTWTGRALILAVSIGWVPFAILSYAHGALVR